jgi:methylmalonyl-CoA mutase N-terminal domain/subunit
MRDSGRHGEAIETLRTAAVDGTNTIPSILDAVRAHATIGEIIATLAGVWGRHRDNIR